MYLVRITILTSLILSTFVLGRAIGASPNFSGEPTINHAIAYFQLAALYCMLMWPWFRAFIIANRKGQQPRVIIFSVVALSICALFYKQISTAPVEGKGYYLLFCLIIIWIIYSLSRFLRERE